MSRKAVDYVVIGAGSAGCVVANRLSADARRSVLLLEAGGPDDHVLLRMPLAFLKAMFQPQFTWNYRSEPEPALNGRTLWLPRGKVLGGTSSINGMFYMRGHSRDFDTWRDMGCEGWGYRDVLPYFKRMETSWRGANEYHGDSGPLSVVAIDTSRLLHEPLMQSAAAAGFQVTQDLHGRVRGRLRARRGDDRSKGSARQHLARLSASVTGRSNLPIEMHALTNKVIIENGRAVGVEYVQHGQVQRVFAEKEVIVCGGTYNSPQLLMLSGIGPAEELRRLGVEPGGRPAGRRRQSFRARPRTGGIRRAAAGDFPQPAAPGPRGAVGGSLGSVRHGRVRDPDQQLQRGGQDLEGAGAAGRAADVQSRPDGRQDVVPRNRATAGAPHHLRRRPAASAQPRACQSALRRSSRSAAHSAESALRSAGHPDLDSGDRRGARHLPHRPSIGLTGRELKPGAELTSSADLENYIRGALAVTQHPVGTCAMGVGPDAVVDPKLRVHGVEGLRVADASIMPTVPGANTNAACIMIGEKASDLIVS